MASTTFICNRCIRNLSRNAPTIRPRGLKSQLNQNRRYTTIVTQDVRPFRLAVIGSGPAGFYTSYKILSRIPSAKIDMYESLPTPFGLVRYGVAPDHPEVKNCQDKFTEVAASPNFNFIGNINIGEGENSLPLQTILPHYDALLFAYGASKDKRLGIPGEDLKGIYSARAFVGWYNGLPEYADLNPDLSGENAVVIGQGNVALDVTRILLSGVDRLKGTDISEEALSVLAESKVKDVRVIGRRGVAQAAFTIKEIRELLHLPSTSFRPIPQSLFPPPETKLPRAQKRLIDILRQASETDQPESASKSWGLEFLSTPIEFRSDPADREKLLGIIKQENKFRYTSVEDMISPDAKVIPIEDALSAIATPLAFRSIGYQSEALPGFEDLKIPFDSKKGVIMNDGVGRVLKSINRTMPGMYCAGWVKRGPTGVIASTMADAFATADAVAEDWLGGGPEFLRREGEGWEGLREEAEWRGCRRVSWGDWCKIDGVEKERGRAVGKERVKFKRVEDMLAVLD